MAGKIADFLDKVGKSLESKQVKVGFIDGATYPDGTSVATVAATDEWGDPGNNQPPRPFFRNAISEHSDEWADSVTRGILASVNINQVLEVVGAQIQGDVKQSIATLMKPALASRTIKLRRERGNNSTKPLVDTRVMISDVSYEVGDIESSQNS